MIDYFKGVYGLNLLFRVHGSGLYKGCIGGLFSVFLYLLIDLQWNRNDDFDDEGNLDHPYGMGVLVSSVTFLIIFRANYGYQRYWEACTSVHHFMSKWMDATIHSGVFHLQNSHYDKMRPPNFFENDDLNKLKLTRDRQRHHYKIGRIDVASINIGASNILKSVYDAKKPPREEVDEFVPSPPPPVEESIPSPSNTSPSPGKGGGTLHKRANTSPSLGISTEGLHKRLTSLPPDLNQLNILNPRSIFQSKQNRAKSLWDLIPSPDTASSDILQRASLNSRTFPSSQQLNQNFGCRPEGKTPPLFLQELAHLSSLMCAVALSTLRNDLEDKESPLDIYTPGSEWPPSDPDKLPKESKLEFQHSTNIWTNLRYLLGKDRTPQSRANYNAARPMLILGGVSNAEIAYLQKARGPYAKTQLAWSWLSEFIIREHLNGSMGEVHSAIVSRMIQFLSDGMIFYNHARKIMYIPFPFPHAQLSVFFTAVMVFTVPLLIEQYANAMWIGCIITFLTVTCLVGLHEVARELENPFRNVPNEIPLVTLHAMYNEALVTMFSGYNPDAFWDGEFYQGMLEAVALGRVYEKEAGEEKKGEVSPSSTSSSSGSSTVGGMESGGLAGTADKTKVMNHPLSMAQEAGGNMKVSESVPDVTDSTEAPAGEKKQRSVRFASTIETNTDNSTDMAKDARELQEVLAKQKLEIEELTRLLDEEEENQ